MELTAFPEWDIKDSSKLSDWLDCPRMYFWKHLLGWKPDVPAQDLQFGTAFHKAREWQLIHGYEDIQGSYNAFIESYREKFDLETDAIYTPKDPTAALSAIIKFAKERQDDLILNEVVELDGVKMVEIAGKVPININRVLYYRMDSIMRNRESGKIFSWDHKTTKRFSRFWREAFHLGIQNGTYTHCLYCMFPIEEVLGIEFCGTAFSYLKRNQEYRIEFERVPAFKTPEQMNNWLWQVNQMIDEIEHEMECLDDCSENDTVMTAFPMRTNSCTKYYGCAYHDFCLSWINPLQYIHEIPLGFIQKFWNPAEMEHTVKKDLEWEGGE